MDVTDCSTAHTDSCRNIGEAAFHDYDIRSIDGDIGSGPDGDTDVGHGKGRSVIDAIPNHGDFARFLQAAD